MSFSMCYLEKEKGRKNLSKLWTQIICINKVNAFDAILTTVNQELETVSQGSQVPGLLPHFWANSFFLGRIWSMALVSPVWSSDRHSISANGWQNTASPWHMLTLADRRQERSSYVPAAPNQRSIAGWLSSVLTILNWFFKKSLALKSADDRKEEMEESDGC